MTTPDALQLLIAARQCEMAELEQLERTSQWVDVIAQVIHALQRERGLSNLYLGSGGRRGQTELQQQRQVSDRAIQHLYTHVEALRGQRLRALQGARLYSQAARALQGLGALAALRRRIDQRLWDSAHSTSAYTQLVAVLLDWVFEAADTATDPDITRWLVALFNLMQGKEYLGQERAIGTAMAAAQRLDAALQRRLLHLMDAQQCCFDLVETHAADDLHRCGAWPLNALDSAEHERLRRILCTSTPGQTTPSELGPVWFDVCSRRIDQLRNVEQALCEALQRLCRDKRALAEAALRQLEALPPSGLDNDPDEDLACLTSQPPDADWPGTDTVARYPRRSLPGLLHEQQQRLQRLSTELDAVRASLQDRKVIERAKGLLMAHRRLSEEQAHRTLRQLAMNQGKRMVDVAQSILATAVALPDVLDGALLQCTPAPRSHHR